MPAPHHNPVEWREVAPRIRLATARAPRAWPACPYEIPFGCRTKCLFIF